MIPDHYFDANDYGNLRPAKKLAEPRQLAPGERAHDTRENRVPDPLLVGDQRVECVEGVVRGAARHEKI